MEINGTSVNGYTDINGTGYWESENEVYGINNLLNFTVSAEWWNVSCKINKIQIN